jgi:hypothetical protein
MEKKTKALRICGFLLVGFGVTIDICFYVFVNFADGPSFWPSPYMELIGAGTGFALILIGGIFFYIAYKTSRKRIQTPPSNLPEGWQCQKCGANNPNTRNVCIYCAQLKE